MIWGCIDRRESTLKTASQGDCPCKINQNITVSNDSEQDARIAALQSRIAELEGVLAGQRLALAATV